MANPAVVRTCCVWCADWPVLAHRRRESTARGVPVAVLERVGNRVVVRAASVEARAHGVRRGMRRREAEACCADLCVVDADAANEARAFESVARAVEQLTPRVVLERPGLLSFPTHGPARYFGGDDALAARVVELVAQSLAGLDHAAVRVGIADGAFAARLAARRAAPGTAVVVPVGDAAAFLEPFPVGELEHPDLVDLLTRLGIATLGAFAALPADAVLARFGDEGAHLHAIASGRGDGPPVLVVPPPDLVEHAELDPPVASVELAAFTAKAMADRMVERLGAMGLACTEVMVEAETEHGERLARVWRHADGFGAHALVERVRWQLDGWLAGAADHVAVALDDDPRARQDAAALADAGLDSTTGALTMVRLTPAVVVPVRGRQLGFWGGDAAAHARADRALSRLQGMLGHEAVVTFVRVGGRTPAEQVRAVPWGEPRDAPFAVAGETPTWPGAVPSPAPARVYDPPVPASLVDIEGRAVRVTGRGEATGAPHRLDCARLPGGGGRVIAWAGPWAHDVRWWDEVTRRRCVRWQVLVDTGGLEVACLVVLEHGVAALEAVYD
ncbi:MAG TPA: DNA polymerase Y family protein [Acidimicrobiia bacterium]|nr:DNA polymerase Y family protein [Acidimicrobiia bacterium]